MQVPSAAPDSTPSSSDRVSKREPHDVPSPALRSPKGGGGSAAPRARSSRAEQAADNRQTEVQLLPGAPHGDRVRRDEHSGRDPEPSGCESRRSPHREQGKRASRRLGVLEERRASRRSSGPAPRPRARRSTADRDSDMIETLVRLQPRPPSGRRTIAALSTSLVRRQCGGSTRRRLHAAVGQEESSKLVPSRCPCKSGRRPRLRSSVSRTSVS